MAEPLKINNTKERQHMRSKEEVALEKYSHVKFGKLYTIQPRVVGTGSFGVAMLCTVQTSSEVCVVKVVNLKTSKHKSPDNILQKEVNIYKDLVQHKKLAPYLVKMYRMTKFEDNANDVCHALVMEYAGKDLDKILKAKGEYAFSRSQLMKIGLELVPALKVMHECHIVHRDIKPANIVMRLSRSRNIFQLRFIDYGLAQPWTPEREPARQRRGAGTPRFCGWRQHFGYAGSPARDIEALIYTLIYLSGKKLPWHGLKISDLRRKTRTIAYTKRDANAMLLCAMLDGAVDTSSSSSESESSMEARITLADILDEIRVFKYQDMPDYQKIAMYFKHSLEQLNEFESFSSNSLTCPNPNPKKKPRRTR